MTDYKITPELKKTIPWKLVVIFTLFTISILIIGFKYFRSQRDRIFTETQNNLTAISTLKIGQIEQWHSERLGDASVIKENEPLIKSIKQFLINDKQPEIRRELTKWMESVNNEYDYNGVAIIDNLLKIRLMDSTSDSVRTNAIGNELAEVLMKNTVIMTDLNRTSKTEKVHIDLLIPLIEPGSKNPKPFGIVILRIDPEKILFPLIQSWPTPSKSSETLILRWEGDSILYLNELRHQKNTALNLRLPVGNENLLGSKVVGGITGVSEGVDYRQIPVVGYLSNIPGFPWFMVAKIDKEELQAPLRRQFYTALIVTILLVLINASVFGFWIWDQQVRSYKNQLKNEIVLRESDERFTTAFQMSPVSITLSSMADNKFIDVNNTFLQDIEYSREEVIGRTARELDIWANEDERLWVINEIREKGLIFGKVISYKSKTGRLIYGLSSMAVVKVNGQPCNLSTVVNITENKISEEKLRETNEYLTNLFNYANAPIIVWDTSLVITQFNPAFEQLSGYKKGEVLGKKIEILFHKGKTEASIDLIKRAVSGEHWETVEIEIQRKDGDKKIVLWNSANILDKDGKTVVETIAQGQDITERKKVEEDLRESETKFRQTFDMSPVGIVMVGVNKKFLRCNNAFANSLGYQPEELIGITIDDLTFPDDRTIGMPDMKAILMGEIDVSQVQKRYLRKDGKIVWGEVLISLIKDHQGHPQYFLGIIQDITESKEIMEALRESEDKFKYVFDHSVIGKSITLPTGEVNVNKAFCDMLGYLPEELTKANWKDISHADDIELTNTIIRSLLAGEKDSARFNKRYIHKDGSVVWTDVGTALRRDAAGKPLYFMTAVIDMTEHKRAEESLRESERRLREAQEMAHLGFWYWDVKTGFVEWSDEVFKIFWLDKEKFTPQIDSILSLSPWPEENQRDKELINKAITSHSPGSYEQKFLRPDLSIGYYYSTFQGNYNEKGDLVSIVGTVLDITERKIAESQIKKLNEELELRVIQRTEQLETANKELEAFSYSVSHDLRSPLRAVHGYTNILLEEYQGVLDEEGRRLCGIISSSATQMGELIDDLLSFSRIGRSNPDPSLIDMKKLVHLIIEGMTSPSERDKIKFSVGKLHKAVGDKTLIGQVWTNLISNAIKYSSKQEIPEISVSSHVRGEMVTYSVKDNGVGFDMLYKNKLFGVFQRLHSGKEFEGNGVGLALVQRIIQKHKGKVWAEGEVGKGATFYFSLPIQDKRQK